MKKKKNIRLSLRKNMISSFNLLNVKGGNDELTASGCGCQNSIAICRPTF